MDYYNNGNMLECTKCHSTEVYLAPDEPEKKESTTKTMDEFVKDISTPVPLVYKMKTLRCRKCGYSVSY